MWTIVAAIAAVLSAIQLIPQAWNAVRARDLSSISLPTFALISVTTVVWMSYGLHLGDWAIIVANGLGFLCALVVIVMKVRKRPPESDEASAPSASLEPLRADRTIAASPLRAKATDA